MLELIRLSIHALVMIGVIIEMPYIPDDSRRKQLRTGTGRHPQNAGELNFLITHLVDMYLTEHGLSYGRLNTVLGVLEAAKLELYRRLAAPYEDSKIKLNGDVYTPVNISPDVIEVDFN